MTKAEDWDVEQQNKQTNKQNPGHLYFLAVSLAKQKNMSIMFGFISGYTVHFLPVRILPAY